MRMGMTTYLNVGLSGMVTKAELLESAKSTCTMSWLILVKASIKYVTLKPISIASPL